MSIVLIVSGSVAAYKAPDVCRRLRECDVRVLPVLSRGGAEFITPLTLASVCEQPCAHELFDLDSESQMGHIQLARLPDAVVIAPASANIIAKLAHGLADDLPSTLLLAADKPVLVFPAMNPEMWRNPAVKRNIEILQSRPNIHCFAPDEGETACGETGPGRMLDPVEICRRVMEFPLSNQAGGLMPLFGKTALVTAGGTVEPIDPVRIITNRSSGRQGFAIAEQLQRLGAEVTLLYGHTEIPPPSRCRHIHTPTAQEMLEKVQMHLPCDIFISCAAVADWQVKHVSAHKIKKQPGGELSLTLTANPDILAWAAEAKNPKRPALVVGFAAESQNLQKNAVTKLERKNCDMLIANEINAEQGFGDCANEVLFVSRQGKKIITESWDKTAKTDIAAKLCAHIVKCFE